MKQQFLDLNGLTELVTYLKKSITEQKEILPYASNKLFPSTGNVNCIYIDTATNSIYRWDSSNKKYEILAKAVKSVSISESTENGKITLTVDGNKTTVPIHGLGSAAYTNSSAYSPAGHTHTKAQVGLGNVDNTADKDKSVKHANTADSATAAGTATTTTNVNGENATVDAARHVWFSDSATETKRNYNDNFKYNPATNTVTTNISGSAASANLINCTQLTNQDLNTLKDPGKFYYAAGSNSCTNTGQASGTAFGLYVGRNAEGYRYQKMITTGNLIYYRTYNSTSWSVWSTNIDSTNYTSYTTTKTGGGASGTWGINVSGGAAYPTGFNSRVTSATWGNQTGILITDWHTSNGGDIQFRDNSGQLNVITDGFFYQNEGRNLVLDSVNYSNYAATKSHTHNYAGSSSAGGNANAAVKLANARKIGSASFDGTADITLSQMGLNVPVEITKADYLAKKKAGTLNANTYYNVIDEYDSANVINDSSVTANSAFSSTKSEKTYAKKSTLVTTTLTASKWTGSSAPYTYVLPVSGATTSNIVEINYASNASSQAIEAYQNAMLADGGQTTNQITIKATEKPTVDIPITIVIRNDL